MNGREAIKGAMDFSSTVLKTYFGDMTDAELMRRPGPGCNHNPCLAKWQFLY